MELRYDACIKVNDAYEPKQPVEVQTIPGGDYAVAKNCPVARIKDGYQYLYGKWLARSSRELRPVPSFLVHVDGYAAVTPAKRRVDIYMPLQPEIGVLSKAEQMKIEVKTIAPRRVAYLRHVGPYHGAYRAWQEFTARLKPDGLPARTRCLLATHG